MFGPYGTYDLLQHHILKAADMCFNCNKVILFLFQSSFEFAVAQYWILFVEGTGIMIIMQRLERQPACLLKIILDLNFQVLELLSYVSGCV